MPNTSLTRSAWIIIASVIASVTAAVPTMAPHQRPILRASTVPIQLEGITNARKKTKVSSAPPQMNASQSWRVASAKPAMLASA